MTTILIFLLVLLVSKEWNYMANTAVALVTLYYCSKLCATLSVGGSGCSEAIPGCKNCKATRYQVSCTECVDGLQQSEHGFHCISRSNMMSSGLSHSCPGSKYCPNVIPGCQTCGANRLQVYCAKCASGLQPSGDRLHCISISRVV